MMGGWMATYGCLYGLGHHGQEGDGQGHHQVRDGEEQVHLHQHTHPVNTQYSTVQCTGTEYITKVNEHNIGRYSPRIGKQKVIKTSETS